MQQTPHNWLGREDSNLRNGGIKIRCQKSTTHCRTYTNSSESANAVPVFVPILISPRGIERFLHRYGSEAPDGVFEIAMHAWLSACSKDLPAYQSPPLRELHHRDMRAFAQVIGLG